MASPYAAPWTWKTGTRSLRADLYAALQLPARVGAQIGIVSDQATKLKSGDDVTFTTAQLQSFYPRGDEHPALPADLTVATSWTLSGMNTLTKEAT